MTADELSRLRKKYIGLRVYAGGELKGHYGEIVDIVPGDDDLDEYQFVVSNDDYKAGCGDPRFMRWTKSELQRVVITESLIPLE